MHTRLLLSLSVSLALQAYEFVPTQPAQVWLIWDGYANPSLMEWSLDKTLEQLPALVETFAESGVELQVNAFAERIYPATSTLPTCYWSFYIYEVNDESLTSLRDGIYQLFDYQGTVLGAHGCQDQIANFVTVEGPKNWLDGHRHVVVYFTDIAEDFGAHPPEPPVCFPRVNAAEFKRALAKREVGLLYSIIGNDSPLKAQNKTNLFYSKKAQISDFFVDESSKDNDEFDTISVHLAHMLSADWDGTTLRTTTTTTTTTTTSLSQRERILKCVRDIMEC